MELSYKQQTIGSTDSGASSGEVYSTEEQVIGTWVNGKPLYRIVYSVGKAISTPVTIVSIPFDATSCHLISARGNVALSGTDNQIRIIPGNIIHNTTGEITGTIGIQTNLAGQMLQIVVSSSNAYSGSVFELIVEYTKTTD